jgi:hypothetical protein
MANQPYINFEFKPKTNPTGLFHQVITHIYYPGNPEKILALK